MSTPPSKVLTFTSSMAAMAAISVEQAESHFFDHKQMLENIPQTKASQEKEKPATPLNFNRKYIFIHGGCFNLSCEFSGCYIFSFNSSCSGRRCVLFTGFPGHKLGGRFRC